MALYIDHSFYSHFGMKTSHAEAIEFSILVPPQLKLSQVLHKIFLNTPVAKPKGTSIFASCAIESNFIDVVAVRSLNLANTFYICFEKVQFCAVAA